MTNRLSLNALTEAGLLLATALALSQVRLFTMPSGGSVSLGAFPIMILAARQGVKTALTGGAILGLAVMAFGPVVVHPLQGLLDYPLAHAALALAGLVVWKNFQGACLGVFLAAVGKLACHVAAGYFFLSGKGIPLTQILLTSTVYNLGHVAPEMFICAMGAGYLASQKPELVKKQANT